MFGSFVVKVVALVGFLIPGANRQVEMTQPVVELREDRIAASCIVVGALSDDLQNIIDSGTPVDLTFVCRLRRADGTPTGTPDETVTHRVTKDLATGAYRINLGIRSLLASSVWEYSPLFRLETVPLWPVSATDPERSYLVEVSARMEPVLIHATGQTFDLMSLWGFRVPENRSERFTRRSLEQRRVEP